MTSGGGQISLPVHCSQHTAVCLEAQVCALDYTLQSYNLEIEVFFFLHFVPEVLEILTNFQPQAIEEAVISCCLNIVNTALLFKKDFMILKRGLTSVLAVTRLRIKAPSGE